MNRFLVGWVEASARVRAAQNPTLMNRFLVGFRFAQPNLLTNRFLVVGWVEARNPTTIKIVF
jgi:hypothetical protein